MEDNLENFPVIPKCLLTSPVVLYCVDINSSKVMDYSNYLRLRTLVRRIRGMLICPRRESSGGQSRDSICTGKRKGRLSTRKIISSVFGGPRKQEMANSGCTGERLAKQGSNESYYVEGTLLSVVGEAKTQTLCWPIKKKCAEQLDLEQKRIVYNDAFPVDWNGSQLPRQVQHVPMFNHVCNSCSDSASLLSLSDEAIDHLVCQCVMYLSVDKVKTLFKGGQEEFYEETRSLYDPDKFQWMSFLNYLFCFSHNCQQITQEQLKDPTHWTDMLQCLERDGIYFESSFSESFWLFKRFFSKSPESGDVVKEIISCFHNVSPSNFNYELFNLFNDQRMSLFPIQLKPLVHYIFFVYQCFYTQAFSSLQPPSSVFPVKSSLLPARVFTYRILKSFGPGCSDFTFRGIDLRTGKEVAIKSLRKGGLSKMTQIDSEITALSSINHINVIHMIEVVESSDKVFIVMECCRGR